MIIDAHVHLASNPQDLERIVNSGIIEQVWIMDIPYYKDKSLFATDIVYGRGENHNHVFEEINFWKEILKRASKWYCWKGGEENIMYLNAKKIMERVFIPGKFDKTNDTK